ncbi:hypothetical protein halTADL_2832 [Halohasta litchfieldiae]|jgi:hypothetical protein|uniref:Uncharacterized protein n=1 Tax=Halohasta litchfieldiae TaxID=1073996 RepID=A0A1H6WH73_9EURY|nr:hypothetical protein [Halohasta litchfieldiae]ATW89543.1 hypothetical protein halTADL_2832 [Halohasta litchfieldiae]SEJ11822.1 hypothetical protein SAMN05444271_12245 [Halohasta litchfieldiae]
MTDTDDRVGPTDEESGAPVDFERLAVIKERFGSDRRFRRIDEQPEFAPDRLVCVYDSTFYPESVQTSRLEIAWYENGDFSLHYHEDHGDDAFDHRWDRHPSTHNTLDHIHPGPDAPTPGTDTTHPRDWRDVLSMALTEIEDRQRGFWTE